MSQELYIQNGGKLFAPVVESTITLDWERSGVPGKLSFDVVCDGKTRIAEGDPVAFKVSGKPMFYGFIFGRKYGKGETAQVTAYDQLRYLKNKDTYIYANKTAAELLRIIARDFRLQLGTVENTGYKIPRRVESDVALVDIIQNALDETLTNRKQMYVLYDDYGKLCLRNIAGMRQNLLIDSESGESLSYGVDIDHATYNRIKLAVEDEEKGKREVYIAQDGANINKWGVLQYFEKIQGGVNAQAKANALLSLHNHSARSLSINGVFGHTGVRGGSLVAVSLRLEDGLQVNHYMVVERVKHCFNGGTHTMDLALRGGDFIV